MAISHMITFKFWSFLKYYISGDLIQKVLQTKSCDWVMQNILQIYKHKRLHYFYTANMLMLLCLWSF